MKELLNLGPGLAVPAQVVTKKLGFIGISGSGKTYAAGRFVEQLIAARAQVVVVDVIGNWWGLRLAADGTSKGIPIAVLGGQRGDIPLEPTGGKLVADTVVDTGASLVLDISDMLRTEQLRFVADFATQLLRRKKQKKSPIHVVWEECQDVVPEYAPGDVARCVGAVSRLAKQGRNFGVGSTFITQRPQAVAKDVLNQIEALFLFNTNGSQEMDALVKWVGRTVPKNGLDPIKKFAKHECLVWSPAWLNRFDEARFGQKWTYDASATPDFDSDQNEVAPQPLDLSFLSKAMAETIERAKDNDPAALRSEIAKLRAELARKPAAAPAPVRVPMLTDEDRAELARLSSDIGEVATEANALVSTGTALKSSYQGLANRVDALLERVGARHGDGRVPPHFDRSPASPAAPPHFQAAGPPMGKHRVDKGERLATYVEDGWKGQARTSLGLKAGARRMLDGIASLHPRPVTRSQVAMLAGIAATGGTFSSYLSDLRKGGLIEEEGDSLKLSQAGISAVGKLPPPLTHQAIVDIWMPKLKAGARNMLDELIGAWPNDMAREALAQKVGIEATGGTFSSYLSDLRTSGCMQDTTRGRVRASANLFPG